jgi:uncharacterized protein DUF1592/uncharacterized protein DUF1588/uncharacterized protein DUF1595/uncharacterized protein DUF1585/uncharacterized protein DUF1587
MKATSRPGNVGIVASLFVLGALSACDPGAPAAPGTEQPLFGATGPSGPSDPTDTVGPAPLRRLSDSEYLNALHDLFPGLNPTLPELPADIPVAGFENDAEGQQPSDVLIARYEGIANLYAEAATPDTAAVSNLVGCADWSTPALATFCATLFVQDTGSRLFRRPLTDAERDRFVLHFQAWQSAVDFEGAARLTLSAMLQSPQFLYRAEPNLPADLAGTVVPVEPYAMASRLSFFLWESVPDDLLLEAASRGELATEEQIRAQAARMLKDSRAERVFWSFHRQWLGLDRILQDEGLVRTPEVDPSWTAASQAAANQETQLFVQNILAQGGSFEDLLTSRRAWVNGEAARLYGIATLGAPTAWIPVSLPETERAGLLTRISYLAGFSHRGATSPPVRGNAIELRFLCRLPVSPPPNADLSQPVAAPDQGPQTNRMLFEQRTSPATCQTCHVGLNGLGFGLENYNAAGHYQTTDNGLPVDATGTIYGTDVDGPFAGGLALSAALGRSASVRDCATEEWLRYALGRAPSDAERPTVTALSKGFEQNGGDVRALMVDVAASPSFRLRLIEEN